MKLACSNRDVLLTVELEDVSCPGSSGSETEGSVGLPEEPLTEPETVTLAAGGFFWPHFLELTDADKNTASDNCYQQKDQKKNWNAVMLTPSSAKRIV